MQITMAPPSIFLFFQFFPLSSSLFHLKHRKKEIKLGRKKKLILLSKSSPTKKAILMVTKQYYCCILLLLSAVLVAINSIGIEVNSQMKKMQEKKMKESLQIHCSCFRGRSMVETTSATTGYKVHELLYSSGYLSAAVPTKIYAWPFLNKQKKIQETKRMHSNVHSSLKTKIKK